VNVLEKPLGTGEDFRQTDVFDSQVRLIETS